MAHFALDRKHPGIEFPGEAALAPVPELALQVKESLFQPVAHGAAVHELDVLPSLLLPVYEPGQGYLQQVDVDEGVG